MDFNLADGPGPGAVRPGKIKYDNTLIKLMSFFESVTRAKLKDCFVDQNGMLVFVVEPAQYGLAVGRAGSNVKRLEATLKRKVKIVEFSDDVSMFVASLIQPSKAKQIRFEDGTVTITPYSSESRGYIIGRAGRNLRNYEAAIRRYFQVKEVRVL
ncbi:MAG TPA: NusA-like transcription termination signal-binding factor [Candidatus Nanoarchaeia archaeon]|nr:NusA-like transcription termination signal-binding factor [Candidatus Nanoarchaeia archaeon]